MYLPPTPDDDVISVAQRPIVGVGVGGGSGFVWWRGAGGTIPIPYQTMCLSGISIFKLYCVGGFGFIPDSSFTLLSFTFTHTLTVTAQ